MLIKYDDKWFNKEELENTSKRHQKFLDEWQQDNEYDKFTVFKNPGYDEMIISSSYFYSLCSHHLLPFFGKVYIGYIPNKKIFGASKLSRIVDKFAHKPQIQERLTYDILNFINELINPAGVMIVIKAEHLCMSMRGIKKPGAKFVTSSLSGSFKENIETRNEFLKLINGDE